MAIFRKIIPVCREGGHKHYHCPNTDCLLGYPTKKEAMECCKEV